MSPPLQDRLSASHNYLTPTNSFYSPSRIDSPIDGNAIFSTNMEQSEGGQSSFDDRDATDVHTRAQDQADQANSNVEQPHDGVTQEPPKVEAPALSTDFRFVVANDPKEFKNKNEMRQNRIHVMNNFIQKAGTEYSSKRRRGHNDSRATSGTTLNSSAPSVLFATDSTRLTPVSLLSAPTSQKSSSEPDEERRTSSRRSVRPRSNRPAPTARSSIEDFDVFASDDDPLVAPRRLPSAYDTADLQRISYPSTRLGASLNPFPTWPAFDNTDINVNQLKWQCSIYFGSRAMSLHWVPTLLQARHTFLSTTCISSAYNDAMYQSFTGEVPESIQRVRVRTEVMKMIDVCLRDPTLSTKDVTLVAVLQLLSGEIIGCNDDELRHHQNGLSRMIETRGGLDRLGVNGELAGMTTTIMFIIAILMETFPDSMYSEYASKIETQPTSLVGKMPESPAYCPPASGYTTIKPSLRNNPQTFELLNMMRGLNNSLIATPDSRFESVLKSMSRATSNDMLASQRESWHNRVFAMRPASATGMNTGKNHVHIYEAVRLTSMVYSTALVSRVPFSKAAEICSSTGVTEDLRRPLHVQIKEALMKTDISTCWGKMAGVLLWISLVAGAAASPRSQAAVRPSKESKDARRWLAAVTIRCSILLGFEHPKAVLGTLKRMSELQRVLSAGTPGDGSGAPSTRALSTSAKAASASRPRSEPAQGAIDFAFDFMSVSGP